MSASEDGDSDIDFVCCACDCVTYRRRVDEGDGGVQEVRVTVFRIFLVLLNVSMARYRVLIAARLSTYSCLLPLFLREACRGGREDCRARCASPSPEYARLQDGWFSLLWRASRTCLL